MSSGTHRTWSTHDDLIPEPALLARQLGWTRGWGKAWSWKRLCDVAEECYWLNRPAARKVEDAA